MRSKRWRSLAACVAAIALVSGCANIPTSGNVGVGDPGDTKEGSFLQSHADGPRKGSSAVDIVQGFLKAATDTSNNFEVAREFLTSSAAKSWKPTSQVTIYPTGSLPPTSEGRQSPKKRSFSLNVPVMGTVDDDGVYDSAPSDTKSKIDFELTKSPSGWRISKLANGIVLSRSNFETFFHAFPIYFFDNSFDYLVPELRWFISRPGVVTNVVDAVLDGPSEWLHGAAISAFPSGTKLAASGAITRNGTATINVDDSVLESSHKLQSLMAAELTNSVAQVQSVSSVRVVAGGRELDAGDAAAQPERQVDSKPVLLSNNQLQLFSSGRVQKVAGTPNLGKYSPSDPAESFGLSRYAFLSKGKKLCQINTSRPDKVAVVAQGHGLVAPSYDPHGWLWTAEKKNSGSVLAIGPRGQYVHVDASWLDGKKIKKLEISRDGARAAILTTSSSGPVLRVVGIIHGDGDEPQRLTSGLAIGNEFTKISDLSWAGPTTLTLIGRTQDSPTPNPWTLGVSGPSNALTSVPGAQTISSANDALDTIVGASGKSLYTRVGSTWSKAAVAGIHPNYAG
ncbi:LpqB family beta-propeller domain-containing protein [Spelaeicoccus albus]|uniref:GerMN domain-containing protein n=1 Tax=Spelaeicoccus albus TaxID=1280376 RepID=A0A7Z0D320_9MICO|nr:LpqB family beta-propeller domain-containing protein [Spelaeicoccus albus]NYI67961.1 hypothetical protein [Spelaeicoccus albus]